MMIRLTPQMKQRLTHRAHAMIERSLRLFPELADTMITIGYTRKHLGSATVVYRKGDIDRMIIRLRVRNVSYQTIGHELTHLIQGLAHGVRVTDPDKVPSGEKQCDIWTLARDPLFCDDPPTYIKMPRRMREHWPDYAEAVRDLCIAAIQKRHVHRQYIRWLEVEIHKLAAPPRPQISTKSAQLALPFAN
ncbi:MAG TPA: hypothetical protein VMT22_11265 [Terriglobales bacterium]|jgi:hypothetical protein|nr:hypothetical protein [Terriglobales bacterium]